MADDTLSVLSNILPQIRQKIEKLRRRKDAIGESNTKAALIDPLLDALGWDVTDPDEVHREYKRMAQDKPVDYALMLLRSPLLFIEAKALGKRLSDRKWISQIMYYATVAGVEWCVLTNGDEYRIYNAHAPVDVEEKLFRSVRISDLERIEFTLETLSLLSRDKLEENLLSVHWKAHFIDRNVKAAFEELLHEESRSLINLIRKKTPNLKPAEIRDSLRRADIRIDFPLTTQDAPAARLAPQQPEPQAQRQPRPEQPKKAATSARRVQVIDLIRAGLIDPPLQLHRTYKGVELTAEVQADGRILYDDTLCNSLSHAGGLARATVIGPSPKYKYHPTNGWTFWKYRDPETGNLEVIDRLNQQYNEMHGSEDATAQKTEFDTVVVPARKEGFERRFIGDSCWFAIRMGRKAVDGVRYIAAYQTAPVSAITHYAEVDRIERYQDTGKYILYFKGPAQQIGPISLGDDLSSVPQSPRYTTFEKLESAQTLAEVFD